MLARLYTMVEEHEAGEKNYRNAEVEAFALVLTMQLLTSASTLFAMILISYRVPARWAGTRAISASITCPRPSAD